jgi:hypothetical protein
VACAVGHFVFRWTDSGESLLLLRRLIRHRADDRKGLRRDVDGRTLPAAAGEA